MLDVHPPHNPTHTWRDFLIHIATIVIGLLIAIGLEQTVEYVHHRHQLHALEHNLDQETDRNLQIINRNIAALNEIIRVQEANKVALDRTLGSKSPTPFRYTPDTLLGDDPFTGWAIPASSVWASARDNGIISLLPSARASYLARLDFSYNTIIETSHNLFDKEYRVQSFVHLHADPNALTSTERSQMLLAISECEEAAAHARMVLVRSRAVILRFR